nr:U4/U6 small nuclear ribonucleoprotein Prp31 homolog [Ziziphus jujuba var. spinosa]
MATLADSFLADLDELSDNDADIIDEDDGEAANMEEDVDGDLADIENLNYDDLDSVSKLQNTQRYAEIMQKVEDALQKDSDASNQGVDQGIVLEDDPEYQLIVECNSLSVDIENEIVIIHNFIRDKYRLKFPELESLVHHPIDYARVVKKIGNEMDVTLVDLEGLLPSAIIMVVSVTASTTSGKPLPDEILQKTVDACDRALSLDSAKKKVLDFVESRMGYIAPNLSAIVGSAVAAKLMGTAGGLAALAKMPACNVQLLGAKKKNLAGFSTATSQFRLGYIEQTEIFQSTPPPLRMRACRLLAAKSTLAARVDSTRGDPSGGTGRAFREEIRKKREVVATNRTCGVVIGEFGVPVKRFLVLSALVNKQKKISYVLDLKGIFGLDSRNEAEYVAAFEVQRKLGDTVVTKIASEENLVDPFTKTLPKCVFEKHVNCMGLKRIPDLL